MKRTVIGVCLLLGLLILGLFVQNYMEKSHRPIAEELESAAEMAQADRWDLAQSAWSRARKQWEKNWNRVASLADHDPMEEIDGLFVRLEVYAARKDTVEFAAACRELARRVQAMADAHALRWQNLL